ncbi:MAG TPA: phenylacetate--CoA ligase family protein [Clostridiaceae bacterium]|nr:phenylacetate--CoA ligase family protein [Clostridiaceae bacterium]
MWSEQIRKAGFYTLDFFNGSIVRKHLKDISDKMNNRKECYNELSDILRYVKENVPFYYGIKIPEIKEFPVIKKKIIKENYDLFQSREFLGRKLFTSYTSGSSGEPLIIIHDSGKRHRVKADLIFFHGANRWNIGERFIHLGGFYGSRTSKAMQLAQNAVRVSVLDFNEEAKESLRKLLKTDKKIRVILGYASALDDFVEYLFRKNDNANMFNIKVIFSDSDTLSNRTKKRLEKMFGCPVINRYSNEENGVLACTTPYDDNFLLNRASFFFELLKLDRDEPVEPGELGRVVVTDLYSRAMPFIRYDTGDLATSDDKNEIKVFTSFQGRVSDLIKDTKGNLISSVIISDYIDAYSEIKKYQLIQTESKTYTLKVVCDDTVYTEEFLKNKCREFLGDDAVVTIDYVKAIPNETTGKYKSLINLAGI